MYLSDLCVFRLHRSALIWPVATDVIRSIVCLSVCLPVCSGQLRELCKNG